MPLFATPWFFKTTAALCWAVLLHWPHTLGADLSRQGAGAEMGCSAQWGDPAFEKQSLQALRQAWKGHRGHLDACTALIAWQLISRLALVRQHAEKHHVLLAMEHLCSTQKDISARAQVGCALVIAELLRTPHFLYDWDRRHEWRQFSSVAASELERRESLWIVAHLERTAPWVYRPDSKAALVALEWLSRASPSAWHYWWKAEVLHRQGSRIPAIEAENLARKAPDVFDQAVPSVWTKPADGVCNSWFPKIGYNAWSGLRMGAGWCSQDAYGREQLLLGQAEASTRGNALAALSLADASVLSPIRVRLAARVARLAEDFYGVGLASTDVPSHWNTERADVTVHADIPLRTNAFGLWFSTGWKLLAVKSRVPAGIVLPSEIYGFTGPKVSVHWDTLDSEFHPKSGLRVSADSFLAVSPQVFLNLDLRFVGVHPWSVRSRSRLDVQWVGNVGPAAFHAWPVLSKDAVLPAVRPYRYMDKSLFALAVSQEWDFLRSFSLAPAWLLSGGGRPHSLVRTGAALSAIWFFSRDRRWTSRLEGGVFAGEWTIQAGLELH